MTEHKYLPWPGILKHWDLSSRDITRIFIRLSLLANRTLKRWDFSPTLPIYQASHDIGGLPSNDVPQSDSERLWRYLMNSQMKYILHLNAIYFEKKYRETIPLILDDYNYCDSNNLIFSLQSLSSWCKPIPMLTCCICLRRCPTPPMLNMTDLSLLLPASLSPSLRPDNDPLWILSPLRHSSPGWGPWHIGCQNTPLSTQKLSTVTERFSIESWKLSEFSKLWSRRLQVSWTTELSWAGYQSNWFLENIGNFECRAVCISVVHSQEVFFLTLWNQTQISTFLATVFIIKAGWGKKRITSQCSNVKPVQQFHVNQIHKISCLYRECFIKANTVVYFFKWSRPVQILWNRY